MVFWKFFIILNNFLTSFIFGYSILLITSVYRAPYLSSFYQTKLLVPLKIFICIQQTVLLFLNMKVFQISNIWIIEIFVIWNPNVDVVIQSLNSLHLIQLYSFTCESMAILKKSEKIENQSGSLCKAFKT